MQKSNSINFLPFIFKLIVLNSIFYSTLSLGKVDPKNYDFSLDQFKDFIPDKSQEDLASKYGKGEVMFKDGEAITLKYNVTHIRYKFPIFVTFFENKSIGFFARLPSYFLHDVFHQSLINRFGKQDLYSKKLNAAIYIWKNEEGMKYTYQGQCTITCFPMYLQVEKLTLPTKLKENPSLLKKAYEAYY